VSHVGDAEVGQLFPDSGAVRAALRLVEFQHGPVDTSGQ
jgi:hypothetical protein